MQPPLQGFCCGVSSGFETRLQAGFQTPPAVLIIEPRGRLKNER